MDFWNDNGFISWYKKALLRERILEETSAWLFHLTSTEQFLRKLGLCLTLSLGASQVAFLIYNDDTHEYRLRMSYGMRRKMPMSLVKLNEESALIQNLSKVKDGLVNLNDMATRDLKRLGGEMCFPVFIEGRFLGVLVIGPRLDRQPYEPEVVSFFHTLTNDIGTEIVKEAYYRDSFRDPLTGFYNRKYLSQAMNEITKKIKRGNGRVAFALIDVDHFKKINDTYGHPAGDYVLKNVADKIKKNVRMSDPCIRYGGEEFCVLFTDFIKRDGTAISSDSYEFSDAIQKLTERLKNEIGNSIMMWEGRLIQVTVSIGIAFYTSSDGEQYRPDDLIQKADEMLYAAKQSGRNRVLVHFQQE